MCGEVRDEEVPRREGQGDLRRLLAMVLGRGVLGTRRVGRSIILVATLPT